MRRQRGVYESRLYNQLAPPLSRQHQKHAHTLHFPFPVLPSSSASHSCCHGQSLAHSRPPEVVPAIRPHRRTTVDHAAAGHLLAVDNLPAAAYTYAASPISVRTNQLQAGSFGCRRPSPATFATVQQSQLLVNFVAGHQPGH